jgi:hypothetical protein
VGSGNSEICFISVDESVNKSSMDSCGLCSSRYTDNPFGLRCNVLLLISNLKKRLSPV